MSSRCICAVGSLLPLAAPAPVCYKRCGRALARCLRCVCAALLLSGILPGRLPVLYPCRAVRVFRAVDQVRHLHAVVMLHEPAADVHAVPLRYAAGGEVVFTDDRIHLFGVQGAKGVFLAGDRRLRRVPVMPIRPLEKVPDFDPARAVAERLQGQPALPEELPVRFAHHAPKPEALFAVAPLLVCKPCLRLFVRKGVFVGVHRPLVLQSTAQGGKVGLFQFAQKEALGLKKDLLTWKGHTRHKNRGGPPKKRHPRVARKGNRLRFTEAEAAAWRCYPDLNRGIRVLQTLALPLGYSTKK